MFVVVFRVLGVLRGFWWLVLRWNEEVTGLGLLVVVCWGFGYWRRDHWRGEREREREMNFLDRKERKPLPWVPTRGEENIHWGECTLKRVVFGDFGVCGRRGKVWVRWLRNLVGVW